MEIMQEIAAFFSDPTVNVILAGSAGGAVKWMRLKEPLYTGLASVAVGGIVAHYMSPIALAIVSSTLGVVLNMTPAETARLGGFLVGSTSMLLVGSTVDLMSNWFDRQKKEGK